MERFFRLENGKVFKLDEEEYLFYSLDENNNWVLDNFLLSNYLDPVIEFTEITGSNNIYNMDPVEYDFTYDVLDNGTVVRYDIENDIYCKLSEKKWINYPELKNVLENTKNKSK